MKKLICAAIAAGSMVAMAEECATAKCAEAAKSAEAAPAAVEAAKPAAKRPQVTPEQRAKMREQREKLMADRKAKAEAQVLGIVKKYVPEEEKAKALVEELLETMMGRRNMIRPPRPPKPAEAK